MKKLLVLTLMGLLILAFGTVYAQEKKEEPKLQFIASGFIDAQSTWGRNITTGNAGAGLYRTVSSVYLPGGDGYDKTVSWMSTRARLKFDAKYGKEVSGTIFFEMDATRWGETGDGRNKMGFWSGDRAALEIKNVFIDFGLPFIPVPVSMRVGLQPLAIRPNVFLYTDGMAVTANIKVDPANIQLIWAKALENKDYNSDDVDVYGVHANAKIESITAGAYWLYYNMNTYPFADGAVNNQADFNWIGLYGDGKVGPVNLNFDAIYDHGKVKSKTGLEDVKYRGWATRLKIDYPWEAFNFGLVFMYASGADANKTNNTGLPGATKQKVKAYVSPPASEAFAIFTESIVFYGTPLNTTYTGIGVAGNYTQVSRGTIGGTWMAKLYGSFKATPWYKVTLQGVYIGDTTKNGNTVGTARKASGAYRDDKTIGWEFDLINEFQIYKQLSYSIGGGILLPGDALKYWDGTGNDKPKTPWGIIGRLVYNF
ncbi:MAG: alginate export family protein [Thermodesulfobacteriota bacterium]